MRALYILCMTKVIIKCYVVRIQFAPC